MSLNPRNYRNNNPGNLRIGAPWKGLMPPGKMNPAQEAEHAFCVFQSPAWGFRALALLLINYGHDGLETIQQVIDRFAPADENNTRAYVSAVCRDMGVGANDTINLNDRTVLSTLCRAITKHESGAWKNLWKDTDLNAGLDMALAG